MFINLEHVHTNYTEGTGDLIKCPVCHNDFLVGADDSQSRGWPYLIHVPRVLKETDDQFIRKDELTCPFLLKPIALSINCPDFYRNVLPLPADHKVMAEPDKFLPDLIKSYSRMMKLRGTTCRYCGGTYEFSYKVDKDAGEFTFNFGCQCISSDGDPDLIQLTQDFMDDYNAKTPVHNKRLDFLNSVISRIPQDAIEETPTAPSTLNSRTLLDKVLSSTDPEDPDLQGELEGLSFLDIVDEGTDEDVSKLDYSDLDVDEERRQVAELQRRNAVSDPEGLYSFAAENRTTDSGLEKVAMDPTFIENLFLGTKNAPQHTGKYNIESYIVHDSAGRTDYVLMYNKSTGKVGISRLGVFYGLRLRVTELDDQRFWEIVRNYGGAVEAEHRALLSIADGGCTPYKDDQDESVGGISTTIGNKLVDRRMLVSLRSTKNTGTLLYAGDYHGYFNIDRESFINNGYYKYTKNTPYMYTPDDTGDTVELFKDAFYMFTDDEIDWNVLMELLKKLPEGVRIQVPGPSSMSGSFWEVETVRFVNGWLAKEV